MLVHHALADQQALRSNALCDRSSEQFVRSLLQLHGRRRTHQPEVPVRFAEQCENLGHLRSQWFLSNEFRLRRRVEEMRLLVQELLEHVYSACSGLQVRWQSHVACLHKSDRTLAVE